MTTLGRRYPDPGAVVDRAWAVSLVRAIEDRDREVTRSLPVQMPSFTAAQLAALPMGTARAGSVAWCSDAGGGAQLVVWNGVGWVKVADRVAL